MPSIPTIAQKSPLPPIDSVMLWLALIQGSSATLSIALYADLPVPAATLATLVSLVWAGMYVVAGVGLFVSFGLNWATWLVRYRLLLVLIVAGALASTAWSVEPRLTAERGAHLFGTTLVALYLGFRIPLRTILDTTARALAILLILSTLAALVWPTLGIEDYQGRPVWRGITASKNTLGFWAAVSILLFTTRLAASRALTARFGWLLLLGLAVLCLAQSVSATSVLALLIAIGTMLYLYAATELRLGLLPMILLGLLVAALAGVAFQSIDTAELIGRSGDLTGRAQVWKETSRLIMQRPLSGFGYGALWFPTSASLWVQQSLMDFSWIVYHAHNGPLHIASEVGLPLTVLTLVFIVQQLVETVWCQYRQPQHGVLFVLGFSVILLVSNYAEARLLINRDLFWIFFVTLPISMVRQVQLVADGTISAPLLYLGAPFGNARGGPGEHRERLARQRALKRRLRVQRDDEPNAMAPGKTARQDTPMLPRRNEPQ